ncbi:MAG: RecX family transcriptional regulator [Clostridia bacterium]|nr:RecX family transcriptional regulator [Clostridia bacterium]MBQ8873151.1 RecX family transcriptional regulator [Clostridia bacterium]
MPIITDMQIQKNNKSRANVYIDGQFAMALEMLTVMKLGLKIGKEVSAEQLAKASFDSEKMVAFDKAVDYLSRGYKTQKQMHDYLVKKGFEKAVVDYVLYKLNDYGYVNDAHYAQLYVQQNVKNKGDVRLRQELRQRGISAELVDSTVCTDSDVALENAQALAQKYLKNKPIDTKNIQRLQRYLLGRGYCYEVVNSVVKDYLAQVEQG